MKVVWRSADGSKVYTPKRDKKQEAEDKKRRGGSALKTGGRKRTGKGVYFELNG